MTTTANIAERLRQTAQRAPHQQGVIFPEGRDAQGRVAYTQLTFQQLDRETDRLARGFQQMGVKPGMRMVLMVRPSLEFISLTFALFKAGAVIVLIDPGMGRTNIFHCLAEVDPAGFVAIPIVQAIRIMKGRQYPHAKLNVTVGKRFGWKGPNYQELLGKEWRPFEIPDCQPTDPAAIIFTSGSTGPPKGVLYEHGMFNAQVDLLRDFYDIAPGEVDLPGFPLFALFNAAMGVTTVVPDMDPTKPALVDPVKFIEAINNMGVTQAFGSPALWNRVGGYCAEKKIKLPSLKRVLSAGAPVPNPVLQSMTNALECKEGDIFTPYGATECLPVCSISGREVLTETAAKTEQGAGTCVGHAFPNVQVRIIEISNQPIGDITQANELPVGEIGEIIVQSPSATRQYFNKPEATANAKIADANSFWHRMGDVGYFDEQHRLWFCGRKAHIVETKQGRLFTIRCEAIFNGHPHVYRSALVGVGEKPHQQPVIIIEPTSEHFPQSKNQKEKFTKELLEKSKKSRLTENITAILFHHSLPVDIRHNVKIFREKLAPWAAKQLER